MYFVHTLLRENSPNTNQELVYDTHAPISEDSYVIFGADRLQAYKADTKAHVTWRPNIALVSARLVLPRLMWGMHVEEDMINTSPFETITIEAQFSGVSLKHRSISLSRTVMHQGHEIQMPVAAAIGDRAFCSVFAHADTFLSDKVSRIVGNRSIQKLLDA